MTSLQTKDSYVNSRYCFIFYADWTAEISGLHGDHFDSNAALLSSDSTNTFDNYVP